MTPTTVIIRAKDEAPSIGRTLALLSAQRRRPDEVIVVDSGSRDETPRIAAAAGARVIEIPAEAFSFGRALNTGCAAAGGAILVALSAHAFPTDQGWLARMVAAMSDERVACACGQTYAPTGPPLRERLVQDADLARSHPTWGYSNAAGAFRADLWRRRGFREEMPASEDKEWALYWMDRGHVSIVDPALVVDHDHSKDGLIDQYRRARRERLGLMMMLGDSSPYSLRDLGREWWTSRDSYRSALRARLSHRRAARLLGEYRARRAGRSG